MRILLHQRQMGRRLFSSARSALTPFDAQRVYVPHDGVPGASIARVSPHGQGLSLLHFFHTSMHAPVVVLGFFCERIRTWRQGRHCRVSSLRRATMLTNWSSGLLLTQRVQRLIPSGTLTSLFLFVRAFALSISLTLHRLHLLYFPLGVTLLHFVHSIVHWSTGIVTPYLYLSVRSGVI